MQVYRIHWGIVLGLVYLLPFAETQAQEMTAYRGHAYHVQSRELAYIEEYQAFNDSSGNSCAIIVFFHKNGHLLGKSLIGYDKSRLRPDVSTEHYHTGYREIIQKRQDKVRIQVHEPVLDRSLDVELQLYQDVVIDTGFNQLVKHYWDTLVDGGEIRFRFLVSTYGQYITFDLKVMPEETDQSRISLVASPSNLLMNWLTPNIVVTYDRDTRALLAYEGLTNLYNKEGSTYAVIMRIEHAPDKQIDLKGHWEGETCIVQE